MYDGENSVSAIGEETSFQLMDGGEFFAPTSSDVIDRLIGEYQQHRSHIEALAGIATGPMSSAIHYFIEGNRSRERYTPSVAELFEPKGAIFSLNSSYWSKLMNLTDVYDAMPQARRAYWNAQLTGDKDFRAFTDDDRKDLQRQVAAGEITEDQMYAEITRLKKEPIPPLPDFEEAVVRDTISGLLSSRAKFFAERVDGIFRALSGDHVTNCPEGFSKRMIIAHVINSYGTTDHTRCGYVSDLRAVIAKFMGRDDPSWTATTHIVQTARNRPGEWITLDGGALRLKCFMVGTCHLEIHPDMAYRLNQVLAGLYPSAIPAKFRQKPTRKSKVFEMIKRPLPFAVLSVLEDAKQYSERVKEGFPERYVNIRNTISLRAHNSPALPEALRVLESIGGVQYGKCNWIIQFDYDPFDVIRDIVASGCIPDQRSHQFYPTPESVALEALDMAQIGPDDVCLEPSAGQGGLAQFMPKDRTTCVEISPLHCAILRAKGFDVEEGDFIDWAARTERRFDNIVANPPYSEGRWLEHTKAAYILLNAGGRLTAILPASQRGVELLPGCEWSPIFENQFAGTSVSVAILSVVKAS